MVDIDTSGPGADVELPEEKPEAEVETKEDSSPAPPKQRKLEKRKQRAATRSQKLNRNQKPEQKKEELETYSKDVQRRIAKLTKKWREAERQKDEALKFAENQKRAKRNFKRNILKLNKLVLKTENKELHLVYKQQRLS